MATIGVLAQTQRQARSIFRYVTGLLEAIPSLTPMVVDQTNDAILLSNRVQIEIAAASFRSTRGYSYAAVLCDEIAFWRDETSLNPDIEILRALRPGMASIPGSILMLASSPYGKKGALYNSFRRNYGRDDAKVLVWKATTQQMNPRIDASIIADAVEEDPEAARAEYFAEFRDDLADFITREAIDAITMWGRSEVPPDASIEYAAFVDPSGGASDSFTLAIGHQAGDLGVLDALLEIRSPFDPDAAVGECANLLKRYRITRVVGDHYAGQWPVARFAAHGVTFEQAARGKSDIYADFLPLTNAGRVELLDHKRLAAQFVSLERRTGRSGKDSIAEPKGAHDDCANACAGVLVALDLDRRPGLVRHSDLLQSNAPLPLPRMAMHVHAVVVASKAGQAGVVYCCQPYDGRTAANETPLLILDYSTGPLYGRLFNDVAERLERFRVETKAQYAAIWVPSDLSGFASTSGVVAYPVPDQFDNADMLLLTAAGHVAAGMVKLCQPAHERTKLIPLSMDFRAGDVADDPLRRAAVLAIGLILEQ